MTDANEVVLVLVVLVSASGHAITERSAQSDQVTTLAPDRAAAARLATHLRNRGCEVGPLVGTSMSVTVPLARATEVLGRERDGVFDGAPLPPRLRRTVHTITRDAPIDFGPGGFR